MSQGKAKYVEDRLSMILAREIKELISGIPLAGRIDVSPSSELCSSLELYLPRLLRADYPQWERESLDGVFVERAIKVREYSLELCGACILISDQTLTPFVAKLVISTDGNAIVASDLHLGEPGSGALGISGPRCNSREAIRYRIGIAERLSDIEWVFSYREQQTDE